MRAAVYGFISPDVDLDDFRPEDPLNFSFLLQALIGPSDREAGESLQFIVCTPEWLARRVGSERVVLGRSLVVVDSPDVGMILDHVERIIGAVESPSWAALTRKLSCLGDYEFEEFV
ncbi:Imm8 family immunity protein [Streptomyces sp. NPDC060064]|uniref:Imm8 family immunity protein n=1 Tax=Streptomyces sp. NPDC060064 TaxID=3347049 RepID=UPI0036A0DBF3